MSKILQIQDVKKIYFVDSDKKTGKTKIRILKILSKFTPWTE